LVLIEHAGHMVMLEKPEKVNESIISFIEDLS
jgi:pimeloyl-ACP methyl ester carboxylesterase